jgi:hypothetical protein
VILCQITSQAVGHPEAIPVLGAFAKIAGTLSPHLRKEIGATLSDHPIAMNARS